ncbi:MAG: hypothetical protein IT181_03895, partial [Acidobacteria bacterium]|nr:hypothetical protein [Acidobacteriota bacterium]
PTELEVLKRLGCPLGQGFLFSRPVPASEMLALLELDAVASTPDWWAGAQAPSARRRRGSDAGVTPAGQA